MVNGGSVFEIPGDWRRPSAKESYRLVWHDGRGYGELLPRPTLAEIGRHYDIEEYYTHVHGDGDAARVGEPPHWKLLRLIFFKLDKGYHPEADYYLSLLPRRDGTILDIGSGHGRVLAELAEHGVAAIGVEPDPAARAATAALGLTSLAGTAEDLPAEIAEGSVALANMSHVLEHCLDPAAALRNAFGKIAEGGLLVLEVPNNECAGARSQERCWHWLDAPRHLNFFTTRSLVAMVEAAGFTVLRVEYCGYARQVMRSWLDAQRGIYRTFIGMGAKGMRDRNDFWSSVLLLLRTALARPAKKYDSVRVVAVKQTGRAVAAAAPRVVRRAGGPRSPLRAANS